MGLMIICGHAILEAVIVTLILMGFLFILKIPLVIIIISIAGCFFLIFFGINIIYNVIKGKINTDFLNNEQGNKEVARFKTFDNPIIGGIVVSMSNPYWWIWWATIGAATLIKFEITLKNWPGLLAFFLGHELGDFAWYIPVSVLAFLGRKKINKTIYYILMLCCAGFMIFFGIFLGISAIINQ